MERNFIKVIVADRSESFVMYMSILLNRMGIDKVIPAESGKETMKFLNMFTPDVVILSTELSDGSGVGILRQIKKPGDIPYSGNHGLSRP
jgi:chemotaxis response regulator CheB